MIEKIDKGENGVIERSKDMWDLTNGDEASIFAQGYVAAPVGAILNVPMLSNQRQEIRRGCLLKRERSEAIGGFVGRFAVPCNRALDAENLSHLGPTRGQIFIEFATDTEMANFEPPMRFIDTLCLPFGKEKGTRGLLEEQGNRLA